MTTAERRDLAAEVEQHLGLVLTTAGALFLITRVYIASGRETGTALLALHDLRAGKRPGRGLLAAAVTGVAAAFVPVEPGTLVRAAALLVLPALAVLGVRGLPPARALWGAALAGVVGAHVLTSSALWLPAERVSVTAADGSTVTHVGYVLEDADGVLRVLNHAPRLVLQLPGDDVTERVLCRLEETDGERESVLSFLLSRADVGSPVSGSPAC